MVNFRPSRILVVISERANIAIRIKSLCYVSVITAESRLKDYHTYFVVDIIL